jgi:hypothetical protein
MFKATKCLIKKEIHNAFISFFIFLNFDQDQSRTAFNEQSLIIDVSVMNKLMHRIINYIFIN